MSKIILRKPKFMRNDRAMELYIKIMASYSSLALREEPLPADQKCDLMMSLNDTIREASKAGGFFRVEDFVDYYNHRDDQEFLLEEVESE